MESTKKVVTKVITRVGPAVKIGLANRTNYDITVEFNSNNPEHTIILPPNYRSGKEFDKEKIHSVNGLNLLEAQKKGLILIIN